MASLARASISRAVILDPFEARDPALVLVMTAERLPLGLADFVNEVIDVLPPVLQFTRSPSVDVVVADLPRHHDRERDPGCSLFPVHSRSPREDVMADPRGLDRAPGLDLDLMEPLDRMPGWRGVAPERERAIVARPSRGIGLGP